MKDYSVNDLKKEVRLTLDQNATGGQLLSLSDIDALMLESIIEEKLIDAARIVEMDAPVHTLGSGKKMDNVTVRWSGDMVGVGSISVPEDFLRLVVFKMSGWYRPVSSLVSITDSLYSLQKSKYAGLRGTPMKPVVALVPSETGQELEFYSCVNNEDSIELCQYIPMPSVDDAGNISLCERLESAIVYYASSLVANSVGESELGGVLSATATELMK